jgi:hypothetical protein
MATNNGVVSKQVKGGYIVAKFHASGYISLNSSTQFVGANTSSAETVRSMNLTEARYVTANGVYFTVARGGNTILVLSGDGTMDFDSNGYIDNTGGEASANCVVTKVGTGPSTCILTFRKLSSITGGSQY